MSGWGGVTGRQQTSVGPRGSHRYENQKVKMVTTARTRSKNEEVQREFNARINTLTAL
jgi:hypothetical protein